MSHRKRRRTARGRNEGEQFLPLPYVTIKSDAWRCLTGPSMKVWMELRSRYNGGNNGRLSLSWDAAARLLGLGKGTVGRAFKELQEKGFIMLVRPGRWYGRLASEWRLTDISCDGYPPTRDYLKWRKPLKAQKTEVGIDADHIKRLTGPPGNRGIKSWSASAPVRAKITQPIGAEMDRLYNHGGGGISGDGR